MAPKKWEFAGLSTSLYFCSVNNSLFIEKIIIYLLRLCLYTIIWSILGNKFCTEITCKRNSILKIKLKYWQLNY